jgi:hypothetical protein
LPLTFRRPPSSAAIRLALNLALDLAIRAPFARKPIMALLYDIGMEYLLFLTVAAEASV